MEYIWRYKDEPSAEKVESLQRAIRINPLLCKLLIQRGINTYEEAKSFFRPQLSDLHDPFLMKDMDVAVERLQKALVNDEKIMVYGDYDVDGTTSVALFYSFLKNDGGFKAENLTYYIPDRYGEGYGVSFKGIDYAIENGFKLIVSLDCGIKSVDKVEYAIKNNIDFIICDHHNVGDELPPATAVLDPKRKDCSYPFKELSGCGVGFKLLQGYCIKQNLDQLKLFSYLDLLSVSIAADLVDMTGENRIFCYYGLKQLTENPKHGLKALLDVASIKTKPRIENIVFGLAPRINAAGRITHAHGALELLLAENEIEAAKAAQILNTTNTERKDYDHITLMEAVEILNADANHVSYHSTVVYKEDWHKGIVGIVASKLIEKYYKPTIVLTGANGKVAGSARSVDGFDVYEAISACAEVLEQFGGHKYAAGLTLKHENIEKFKQLFEKQVAKTLLPDQKIPKLDIDLVITPSDVNAKFFNIVEQMGPFGPGNMTPTFELRNCIVTDVRLLKEKHLKFWVYTDSSKKYKISAIAFNLGDKFEIVNSGLPINIAFHLMENDFQGNKSIELNVKDVKLSEKS